MYKDKFVSDLSTSEAKEYYDELRQKFPLTEEQWADFNILKEKLIAFAYKILDGVQPQPCEDAISREDAIRIASINSMPVNECVSLIRELPSVQPQPFIDKPCISEGVCREDKMQVLDKIRAEIEKKVIKRPWLDFEDRERDRNDAFLEALDIIDKYKAESEDD